MLDVSAHSSAINFVRLDGFPNLSSWLRQHLPRRDGQCRHHAILSHDMYDAHSATIELTSILFWSGQFSAFVSACNNGGQDLNRVEIRCAHSQQVVSQQVETCTPYGIYLCTFKPTSTFLQFCREWYHVRMHINTHKLTLRNNAFGIWML
jgi:hypothetical protein